MKKKIIDVLICVVVFVIATPSVISLDNSTAPIHPSTSYEVKNVILFGRCTNKSTEGDTITVEAVNLRGILRQPFQMIHFNPGQALTFSNQYRGLLLAKFIIGSFTLHIPFNTNSIAVMDTTMGTITIELYQDKMQITTENFIALAQEWFFSGLVFHRVIDRFVIQGGGHYPNGTLKESPFGPIDLETHPDVRHLDGTISMARTSDPNSATSQFFICDRAQPSLDGQYAAFGRVIDGMDVVRAISAVETTTRYGYEDWPVDDIIITNVTIISP
jgi:cyclophilin family peptidyl-prolyl cis-trans isomerase